MARRSKNKRPKGLQLTLGTCWPALLPTVVRLQTLRDRPRPAPRRQRQVPLPRFLEPRPRVAGRLRALLTDKQDPCRDGH